jgi:hypothetical protein
MPSPSSADLATLPNDVGVADAWAWWVGKQTSSPRVVVNATPETSAVVADPVWWRSRRVGWGILAASVFASAWVLSAQVRPLATGAARTDSWTLVADTSLAHVNGVLLNLGQVSAPIDVSLTPADVAALVFGSSLRRRPPAVTDLEARVDTLMSIRGRVAEASGVSRFELRGNVRVARPGLGQFDIVEFYLLDGSMGRRAVELPSIRFSLPRFVRELRIVDDGVMLSTRRGQSR